MPQNRTVRYNDGMAGDIDDVRVTQQWVAAFDAPAYLRRARATEAAWEQILRRCSRQRAEWLQIPRLRLGILFARLDGSHGLRAHLLDPGQFEELAALHADWQPSLRMPVVKARSTAEIGAAIRQTALSFERFNRRWEQFLSRVDLTEVNRLRDGYNRYYVMEKECAVRSAVIALAGFRPLPAATIDDLRIAFPPLPELTVPRT